MDYSRRGLIATGAALASMGALSASPEAAALTTGDVDYDADGAPMQGYLAFDGNTQTKRPGILVAHTRRGIGDFIRERTRTLAELGYVAFAADVFGKGIRPVADADASRESGKLKSDRPLTRRRITAAYDLLGAHPLVANGQMAIIGYCMGGMVALELARSGAPVLATAVFHGTLSTPTPADARNIKGRVLIMHGAEDRTAPLSEVFNVIAELRDAKVPFDLQLYGGVVHGFTETKNGNDPSRGTAYNEHADKVSWAAMQDLFKTAFHA